MANKKLKKRSLSESNIAENPDTKDVNGVVSNKKVKVEETQGIQNENLPEGKAEQLNKQTDKIVNKKKLNQNKDSTKTEQGKQSQKKKDKEVSLKEAEGKAEIKIKIKSPAKIRSKIKEIQSRETLTKTAKKKLAALKKLLRVMENPDNSQKNSTDKPTETVAKKKGKKRAVDGSNATKKSEKKLKTNSVGKKGKAVKKAGNENVTEGSSVQSTKKKQNKQQKKQQNQVGSLLRIPQKEDEKEEGKEEVEVEQEKSKEAENNEQEVEEKNEEGENKEGEEAEGENTKTVNKKAAAVKKNGSGAKKTDQVKKKKRYVLFVGNLPPGVTVEQIKEHFLTKVSAIVSVRIPKEKEPSQPQNFCYVEVGNPVDFEKGLSLNDTFLGDKKIRVEYSTGSNKGNKKALVAKKLKLEALRKSGKLAGSEKQVKLKAKRQKQKEQAAAT